jgi:hypothetical protein
MLGLSVNTSSTVFNDLANSAISSATSSLSGGASFSNALGSTASSLLSPYTSILGVVGLGGQFQNTFGSVLANGFQISCWGSSNPPTKTKGNIEKYHQPYFNQLLSALQNGDQNSVNRFVKDVYIAWHGSLTIQTATKWSSCSAKGLKMYLDFMQPLKDKADETVKAFVNAGATKIMNNGTTLDFKMNGYLLDADSSKRSISYPVLNFSTIKSSQPTIEPLITTVPKIPVNLSDLSGTSIANQIANINEPLTKQPTFDGGNLENVTVDKKSPKETSSFPWWVVALGLGMM